MDQAEIEESYLVDGLTEEAQPLVTTGGRRRVHPTHMFNSGQYRWLLIRRLDIDATIINHY